MFGSRTHDHPLGTPTPQTTAPRRGRSLARGPAWIAGLVLAGFGLAMFFKSTGTPLSTAGFPDGSAAGDTFLGFETNAWTAWGTTAAGVLVLIGAAQHVLAKAISLLTGLALGAAAVLAAVNGDVLGLAAANFWTIVGWGVAAGILLATALLPRTAGDDAMADQHDLVAEGDIAREREQQVAGSTPRRGLSPEAAAANEPAAVTPAEDRAAADDDTRVGPGTARSEPLRRTYRDSSADEVDAARRAEAEETARRD